LNAPPLTSTAPVRIRRATSSARPSLPQTPPASPYRELLAIATASSSPSNGMIDSTGPKISSCASSDDGDTSAKTVGETK
jgi:hypothetical protein